MDETIEIDGVTYIRLIVKDALWYIGSFGDTSAFLNNFSEKERAEIRKKAMKYLVEAGYYARKDGRKKENSIYKADELFYGM